MMRAPRGRWTDVFLAFRLTLDPRKLWLAFRGLVLTIVLVTLFLGGVACLRRAPGTEGPATDVWGALARGDLGAALRATQAFALGLLTRAPRLGTVLPLLGAALLSLLTWTYYAGAIMRLAAVEYALGERIELASGTGYARRKYLVLCSSVLLLVALAALLVVGIAFVGLIAANVLSALVLLVGVLGTAIGAAVSSDRFRSSWAGLVVGVVGVAASLGVALLLTRGGVRVPYVGEVVAALLSPLAFLAGVVLVVLVLWIVLGSPLMFGAVSSSDGDLFEAWSRSFHYLFTKPWLYLFLGGALAVYGAACLAFVLAVRVGAEWATAWALGAGLLGHFRVVYHATGATLLGPAKEGTEIVQFLFAANRLLLNLLVLSYWATFKCVGVTLLYFLLRQSADGTRVSDVHLEPRDREFLNPSAPAAQE
jgi:hypothetical protein